MFRCNKKRVLLVAVLGLCAGISIVLLASFLQTTPTLTQKARVCLGKKADLNFPEWVSNDELLFESSTGPYFLCNVQTQRETNLDTLSKKEVVRWLDKSIQMTRLENWQNKFPLNHRPKTFTTSPFQFGEDSHVTECVTSPTKNKRAWRVEFEDTPLMERWLHRIYSGYKPVAKPTVGLCVSDMNGKNTKLLGVERSEHGALRFFEPAGADGQVKYRLIHDIHWTPDGKNISFVHKDSLYVLPAE